MQTKVSAALPFLGALVTAFVVLVMYQPALGLVFSPDDFIWLNWGGRLPLAQYFLHSIDLADFRPLQATQWNIAYHLWGEQLGAYHLLNVLFHLATCLLLFRLTRRIYRHWRTALVAALIFATLTVSNFYDANRALNLEPTLFLIKTHYSIAVLAPGVPDPLEAIFFLLALDFWLTYLQHRARFYYSAALVVTICALFTKELGVVLIALLFLQDRWLVSQPAPRSKLVRRYLPFAAIVGVYIPWSLSCIAQVRTPWRSTVWPIPGYPIC